MLTKKEASSLAKKLKRNLHAHDYEELYNIILNWFQSSKAPPQDIINIVYDTWSDEPDIATQILIAYLSSTTSIYRRRTHTPNF
jgi:hypothetical protein